MYYPATFNPHQDGRYDVTFVDLPGCVSQGKDLEDALRMAKEALALHLGGMMADGDPLPTASTLETARRLDEVEALEENDPLPAGALWQYVLVDVPPSKVKAELPVRLSISLKPAIVERIDAMAEEMGLTRSGLIAVATRDYVNRMQS
jgi:predicted RNase H-like HicB family nuclease